MLYSIFRPKSSFDNLFANFDFMFDDLFPKFPTSSKPPISSMPVSDDGSTLIGWKVFMALSGYSEDEVEVWNEGSTLHIEGDNTSNETLPAKFRCSFHHSIIVNQDLVLENSSVSLDRGMLEIVIPVKDKGKESSKNLLFGKT